MSHNKKKPGQHQHSELKRSLKERFIKRQRQRIKLLRDETGNPARTKQSLRLLLKENGTFIVFDNEDHVNISIITRISDVKR